MLSHAVRSGILDGSHVPCRVVPNRLIMVILRGQSEFFAVSMYEYNFASCLNDFQQLFCVMQGGRNTALAEPQNAGHDLTVQARLQACLTEHCMNQRMSFTTLAAQSMARCMLNGKLLSEDTSARTIAVCRYITCIPCKSLLLYR